MARSEAELQELVTRLYGAASDMGMRINVKKTEVCDDDTPPMSITVNGEPITEVTSEQGSASKPYVTKR